MDTDHKFDPDIVGRLVRLADYAQVDVLSAVYQMKSAPHVPVVFQWIKLHEDASPTLQPMWWDLEHDDGPRPKLLEIGSAGAGCLFIRRSVFDRIAATGENPFDHTQGFSEDHSFFLRCKELGIKCYAALDIHSYHLRVAPVTLDDLDTETLVTSQGHYVGGFH